MNHSDFQLATVDTLTDARSRLLNILTLVSAPGSFIIFLTMFAAEAPNYMRALYLFPFLALSAHPNLLPFKLRTFLLAFVLIIAGIMVSEGRMEPIGGRLYIAFSATICAVLLNIPSGILVLLTGSFSLFLPYALFINGYYPDLDPAAVPPLKDWVVQIVTGLLPGLLFVLSFGYAFKWIRESEEKYRLVTDHAVDIIWAMDTQQTITFVTPSVKGLLGFEVSDLLGRKGQEITGQQGFDRMSQLLSTGVPFDIIEIEIVNKAGESVWVESRSDVVRNENGDIIGLTGIFRDITARRAERERGVILEEQLRQSQKMESIGQLAGGIAHDFNNLLGVILGYTEIIKANKLSSDELDECIDEITSAGSRAAGLTQQLLLFSRKQTTQFSPIDCNELLENLETMLVRLVPENITLTLRMEENLNLINADSGQIEQVIMNLIINAKDAMPEGGAILIETEAVSIDTDFTQVHLWSAVGDYVRLKVVDTGTGIPEEIQAHIFEPFYTSKEEGKGTGLGLSVIYGIMQQHEGFVNFYSEQGLGTEFQLYFPITKSTAETIPDRQVTEVVGGSETVLIIEDNRALREVAQRLLFSAGYTILSAESGEQGIEIFNENEADISLIFSDIMLTGMSGWDVVNKISDKNTDIKFLLSSGYTTIEIEDRFNHIVIIPKPYSTDTLLRAIRKTLD